MVDVFDRHEVRFDPRLAGCSRFVRYSDYAALEAQLAVGTDGVKVKVKVLEWEERVGVEGTFDAYTSIGHYIATITDDDRGMWFAVGLTQSNYCAPDIDIAKAAAQADYERRILAALEASPPAPKVTGRWRFDIQYGPEGEANYAWVYDETDRMICTAKTHDAARIVEAVNAYAAIAGRVALQEGNE